MQAIRQTLARSTLRSATFPVPRVARLPLVTPRASYGLRFNSTKAEQEPKAEKEPEAKPESKEEPKEGNNEPVVDPVVEELKTKLAEKDKALAEMKNHYVRAVADFRSLQETTQKEMQKVRDFALQKFAKDLLESVDNFSLALGSVNQDTLAGNSEVKNLFDGVNMTRNVFEKTLEKHGIEKIDPMGEQFDPNQHEATFEIPQPDKEPGTVFHVQQHGYTLNKRVLRPAKVGLVKDVEN